MPFSVGINKADRALIDSALSVLQDKLAGLVRMFEGQLGTPLAPPADLRQAVATVVELRQYFARASSDFPVLLTDERLGILRLAVALRRRAVAEQAEKTQEMLSTPEVIGSVEKVVEPWDKLLQSDYLKNVEPDPLPRLGSYFTAYGRQSLSATTKLSDEEKDPKHHILLSSRILLHDLSVLRAESEDRRRPLAVAFADVDDFKAFNTAKGESYVDRFVLPPILNAIETSMYGHGRVYQHGGDEFALVLPNTNKTVALDLTTQLASAVAAVHLEGMPHQPRLSIGVWITQPESHLTANELIQAAAIAKQKAKKIEGKNRIIIRTERASEFDESIHEVKP
jgi:diguanylate cyclase (GGDEF)-like protein